MVDGAVNLAVINSRASAGVKAPSVSIEVHLTKGLPGLNIVGLPETAVKESRHRVRSAIINTGFEFPVKRITVSLAPADLPKEGGRFDLPIALGILAASDQIPKSSLVDYEFAGELALSGEIRGCGGILPFAFATSQQRRKLIISSDDVAEARLIMGLEVYGAQTLLEVCSHLVGKQTLQQKAVFLPTESESYGMDFSEIQGQARARRALEIAAAGGHSILMMGPPGSGKTMLASRLPGILPKMTESQALSSAMIYSISHTGFNISQWQKRPFRAPHHTASSVALVGGGRPPKPGEISLAHQGVLFLDELPEFNRCVLESLREPLEAGTIKISRAAHQVEFPAEFQLIAAMNPCPCGYHGDIKGRCRCTQEQVQRYQSKISGPLLDRIDIHLSIQALPASLLMQSTHLINESNIIIKNRVTAAHQRQLFRQNKSNVGLNLNQISEYCALSLTDQQFLVDSIERLGLSARGYHRILKLSRTIADLAESDNILKPHLHEALGYRQTIG